MLLARQSPSARTSAAESPEALIEEARRRTRHRRVRIAVVLLAATAALAAALGGGGGGSATRTGRGGASPSAAGERGASARAVAASVRLAASFETIAFVTPTLGYGLIANTAGPCTIAVARTSDGGASFAAPVRALSWPCADSAPAQSLTFDGRGDGFLYGPDLSVTHDGGRSWHADPQGGAVVAVAALGRSVWMVEGRCPAGLPPGSARRACSLDLLESADGGRTWAPAPEQPSGAATTRGALTLEPAQGQSWLVRTSPRAAYLLSGPMPADGHAAPIWRTADGGATWTRRSVPCLAQPELIGGVPQSLVLAAAAPAVLFAVCAGEPGAGFQAKTVAVSTDGGRTWAQRTSCASLDRCTRAPLERGYLGELVALSARVAFVTGPRASILATDDGGRAWHAITAVAAPDAGATAVLFVDRRHGVALGDGRIWHSADGGASWTAATPPRARGVLSPDSRRGGTRAGGRASRS